MGGSSGWKQKKEPSGFFRLDTFRQCVELIGFSFGLSIQSAADCIEIVFLF
jgi:hypothetical protein